MPRLIPVVSLFIAANEEQYRT